jgi:hypothetical protein
MRQLQLFTTTPLAAMRDRTASRHYSAARDKFRREHERHRAWGLARRHAERLRRPPRSAPGWRASNPAAPTRDDPPSDSRPWAGRKPVERAEIHEHGAPEPTSPTPATSRAAIPRTPTGRKSSSCLRMETAPPEPADKPRPTPTEKPQARLTREPRTRPASKPNPKPTQQPRAKPTPQTQAKLTPATPGQAHQATPGRAADEPCAGPFHEPHVTVTRGDRPRSPRGPPRKSRTVTARSGFPVNQISR